LQYNTAKMPARSIAHAVALFSTSSDAGSNKGGGMPHQPLVTRTLARYITATRWEDIPHEVQHQAKRSLINLFAVALAGCRTEPIEIALASMRSVRPISVAVLPPENSASEARRQH
jgi:2-methylcitrate dehydratase MmgE/PrpD-like protein